jgi:hypothetical protein
VIERLKAMKRRPGSLSELRMDELKGEE